MIMLMQGKDDPKHQPYLDQMFCLRARQFHDRRSWRVKVRDRMEIDGFDELSPLYLCLCSDTHLIASLRLLPTNGPHMLSDVFPETMGERAVIRHAAIWESSRFCVDTEAARVFGADGVNLATRAILAALFETARALGLNGIVSVFDIYVERILRRAGCRFERLGPVVRYDGLGTVAGLFEVSTEVIDRISADDPRIQTLRQPGGALTLDLLSQANAAVPLVSCENSSALRVAS